MASGDGTNAINIIKFLENKSYFNIIAVVSDNPDADVLRKTVELGVPVKVFPFNSSFPFSISKKMQESEILSFARDMDIEWVFLAGYMKILSPVFIKAFYDSNLGVSKIINIHPSLLPLFPGKNAYKKSYDSEIEESGVTIHFVDSGVDTGTQILQKKFKREKADTFETFKQRGQKCEHSLYLEVIELIASEIGEEYAG